MKKFTVENTIVFLPGFCSWNLFGDSTQKDISYLSTSSSQVKASKHCIYFILKPCKGGENELCTGLKFPLVLGPYEPNILSGACLLYVGDSEVIKFYDATYASCTEVIDHRSSLIFKVELKIC